MIKFRSIALTMVVVTSLYSGALFASPLTRPLFLYSGETEYEGSFLINSDVVITGGAVVPFTKFDSFNISIGNFNYDLSNLYLDPDTIYNGYALFFSGLDPFIFGSGSDSLNNPVAVCPVACGPPNIEYPVLVFQGQGWFLQSSTGEFTVGGFYQFQRRVVEPPPPPPPSPVPAPATIMIFGLGLAGLGWSRRRKTA